MVLPQPYCILIIGSMFVMGEEFLVEFDVILSPHDPDPISLIQQQSENLQLMTQMQSSNACYCVTCILQRLHKMMRI